MKIIVSRENGKKKVRIGKDKYDMYLTGCRNGYQFSTIQVDDEALKMIQEVIEEYFEKLPLDKTG